MDPSYWALSILIILDTVYDYVMLMYFIISLKVNVKIVSWVVKSKNIENFERLLFAII